MRTTLTLDPDVEALVKRSMRERGIGMKEAVNSALRAGLTGGRGPRFTQSTHAMGFRPEITYDKALRIAGALEQEEILRKLAMGR